MSCVHPAPRLTFMVLHPCFVSSAAAKKAAGSQAESPGHKVPKEGVNGEVEEEEEPSGRAEDGPGAASGSRPRVARTPEAGEAGGPGEPGPSDGDGWGGLR